MISGRKALNVLIHALTGDLLDLQERIIRMERFGGDSVGSRVVGCFETDTLEDLEARYRESVKDLRELQRLADQAAMASMKDFVDAIRSARKG